MRRTSPHARSPGFFTRHVIFHNHRHPTIIPPMRALGSLLLAGLASANFFDFFGGHQQQQQQQQRPMGAVLDPAEHENGMLNFRCPKYLCPDTGICAELPQHCPCPYPGSQLRCELPNRQFVCILKPPVHGIYDGDDGWKVDAGDNKVRDCGWVKRAFEGLV